MIQRSHQWLGLILTKLINQALPDPLRKIAAYRKRERRSIDTQNVRQPQPLGLLYTTERLYAAALGKRQQCDTAQLRAAP